ncbi:hypothetical protein VaNZ11_015422, partial [Volvox africanus]
STPAVLCWACGVLVQIPIINGQPAMMFRCGWCGAVSEAAPDAATQQRPRRWRGPWRAFMRLLSRMSYLVVAFVLALITSIVAPGVGLVLPRIATTMGEWLLHISISYILTVGVLFNYLAATFTSPGAVTECCGNIPSAFRPMTIAFAAGSSSGSRTRCGGSVCSVNSGNGNIAGGSGSGEVAPAEGGAGGGVGAAAAQCNIGGDGGCGYSREPDGIRVKIAHIACSDRRSKDAVDGCNQHDSGGGGGGGDVTGGFPRDVAAVDAAAAEGGGGGVADPLSPSATVPLRAEAELVPQYSYAHLRYCWPCRGPQTQGSHHCYMCGRCVVDHDHHCPFIANCVGRANLRNFISFLGFTAIAMIYCAIMSSCLLIRDRGQAWGAVETATVMARRSYAAASTVAAAGGGRWWFLRWLSPLMPRVDAAATYGLTLVDRAPLHISVAAYILIASLAILASVSILLSKTIRHAVHIFNGVHPAALEEADAGGWAITSSCLRRVMVGNRGGNSSFWMWVWPMWGPPPGVLLEPSPQASERPSLEPLQHAGGPSSSDFNLIKAMRRTVASATGTAAARAHVIEDKAKTQ